MGKKAILVIKESLSDLKKLKTSQTSLSKQKRIIALIRIKEKSDNRRQELANYLGVHIRTLERWVKIYKNQGLCVLLEIKARRSGSKYISPQIHEGLSKRLNDPQASFLGYWEVQHWIELEYGVKVKYHRVREYLIKHFGTKPKSTRKSHIKKDDKAVAFFKKPS